MTLGWGFEHQGKKTKTLIESREAAESTPSCLLALSMDSEHEIYKKQPSLPEFLPVNDNHDHHSSGLNPSITSQSRLTLLPFSRLFPKMKYIILTTALLATALAAPAPSASAPTAVEKSNKDFAIPPTPAYTSLPALAAIGGISGLQVSSTTTMLFSSQFPKYQRYRASRIL